ncbi:MULTISPECIES: NifU family protein [Megasphaera]|uniref:NifU-like protein n=1 Tax=Megasphaera vaginalis (ex Srinivasan et al. 2021) TaxID=1111454 RepID=U7UMB3_9FIRM|nr:MULTISPECIES: NifU family protein [Megasphaera]ERT59623.1 NifU-like protein [Megasphaera vaginalis (ex Srinivasan et al. 2021)]
MTPTLNDIETVLERQIRPILANHHGDVAVVDYTDHVLRIRLTGRCSACPSALLTTEEIIAAKVKEYLPQIRDVILVSGVSDDLISQAKSLLAHHSRP